MTEEVRSSKELTHKAKNEPNPKFLNEAAQMLGNISKGSDAAEGASFISQKNGGIGNPKTAEAERSNLDKSFFTVPYNKDEVDKLIHELGATKQADRNAAQNRLTRMGPKVLPQLERAQKSSRDAEIRMRAGRAIDAIDNEIGNEEHRSWQAAWNEMKPTWKELVDRSGRFISTAFPQTVINAEGELKVIGGTSIGGGPAKSAPTEEERQKFESLINNLDKIDSTTPRFQKKLTQMKEKIFNPDSTASHNQVVAYFDLCELEIAKQEARVIYADALAVSKNNDDRRHGGKILIEHLQKSTMLNYSGTKGLNLCIEAVKLGVDKDPKFAEAFKSRGGSIEELKRVQAGLP